MRHANWYATKTTALLVGARQRPKESLIFLSRKQQQQCWNRNWFCFWVHFELDFVGNWNSFYFVCKNRKKKPSSWSPSPLLSCRPQIIFFSAHNSHEKFFLASCRRAPQMPLLWPQVCHTEYETTEWINILLNWCRKPARKVYVFIRDHECSIDVSDARCCAMHSKSEKAIKNRVWLFFFLRWIANERI